MGAGKNLQSFLKDKNITVTQLSKGTGISSNTLYAIIKRDSNINATTINKIAEYLQMSIDELSRIIISDNEDINSKYLEPHTFDTNLETLSDKKDLIKKLNDLTSEYQMQTQSLMNLQARYQEKKMQHAQIEFDIQRLTLDIQHLQNDIKTRQLELHLIQEKIAEIDKKNIAAQRKIIDLFSGSHVVQKPVPNEENVTFEMITDDDKKEED